MNTLWKRWLYGKEQSDTSEGKIPGYIRNRGRAEAHELVMKSRIFIRIK